MANRNDHATETAQQGDAPRPDETRLDAALAESMGASDPPSFGPITGAGAPEADDAEIRLVAYWLWCDAGCPEGRALEFWLAAEEQLRCP